MRAIDAMSKRFATKGKTWADEAMRESAMLRGLEGKPIPLAYAKARKSRPDALKKQKPRKKR